MDLDFAELFQNIYQVGTSVGVQVVCAVIAAVIYAAKGKSWGGGAALGFFLGPLGVFIALVTSGRHTANKHKEQTYTPESTNSIPQMRTVQMPISEPAPQPVQYKMPGRCPSCNAPLRPQELHSPYTSCIYCGSQIEAIAS